MNPVDTNEIRAMLDATTMQGPLGAEQVEQLLTVIDSLQIVRDALLFEITDVSEMLKVHMGFTLDLARENEALRKGAVPFFHRPGASGYAPPTMEPRDISRMQPLAGRAAP